MICRARVIHFAPGTVCSSDRQCSSRDSHPARASSSLFLFLYFVENDLRPWSTTRIQLLFSLNPHQLDDQLAHRSGCGSTLPVAVGP